MDKGHSDSQLITFLKLKTVESLEFLVKAYWSTGMKINTNDLGHMTKMAASLLYGQNI